VIRIFRIASEEDSLIVRKILPVICMSLQDLSDTTSLLPRYGSAKIFEEFFIGHFASIIWIKTTKEFGEFLVTHVYTESL